MSDEEELEEPHADDSERENRGKREGSQPSNTAAHPTILEIKFGGEAIAR